ncbi:IS110 family transposase, partial [Undibacterium sp. CY18W]|nr:IS110 family transposase [Undibacterium hunanense]
QIQALHRVREAWVKHRTATANQIRGLLAEFGRILSPGLRHLRHLRREVALWQEQSRGTLGILNGLVDELLQYLSELEDRISK